MLSSHSTAHIVFVNITHGAASNQLIRSRMFTDKSEQKREQNHAAEITGRERRQLL